MSGPLDQLNEAEKVFAAAHGLPSDLLDDLHALRKREFPDAPDAWHQVAVWIAAPVLAGFAQWMARQSSGRDGLSIGVMREGRMLARLMQTIHRIEAREVWLNRNLAMLAAFGCGDDEALINWLVRTRLQPLTRAEAWRGLVDRAYDAADAKDAMTVETVGSFLEQLKKSGAWEEARRRALMLADRLLAHWRKTAGEAYGKTIFLMDFASVGNIQRSLQTICAAKNIPLSVTGLNFCMTAGSRWAEDAGCVMRGYLAEHGQPSWFASACARTPELMEIFTANPVGSLHNYGEGGEPVCGASFLAPAQQTMIRELQEKILAAATIYHRHVGNRLTADLARCLWGRLVLEPLAAEAKTLSDWPLDAGLDDASRRVLAARLSGSPAAWSKMQTAWPAASRILNP